MNSRISKVLNKRGIKSVGDLTPEERADVMRWESVLSKDELTAQDIERFCLDRAAAIEKRWSDTQVKAEELARLVSMHCVYRAIASAIRSPAEEKARLEKYLVDLAGG